MVKAWLNILVDTLVNKLSEENLYDLDSKHGALIHLLVIRLTLIFIKEIIQI